MLKKTLRIIINIISIILAFHISIKWQEAFASIGEIIGGTVIFFLLIGSALNLLMNIKTVSFDVHSKHLLSV